MSSNTARFAHLPDSPISDISIHQYDDIINCDRPPLPADHPPMDKSSRAAQFMPFSALSGYQDVVDAAEADSVYRSSEIITEEVDILPDNFSNNFSDDFTEFSSDLPDIFPDDG